LVLEAIIYVAEEPLTLAQIAAALEQPTERVQALIEQLVAEFDKPEHGVTIREVAGGYKMATKPEHHEAVHSFVKSLKPPLKLSLPALETLAVIAYKQPVTAPEIMEIRGVQGAGVLKTLLDRRLIAAAGRKNVIGKPILYKTTKEFLIQFGLKDLSELPTLKEFEEIRRMAFADGEPGAPSADPRGRAGSRAGTGRGSRDRNARRAIAGGAGELNGACSKHVSRFRGPLREKCSRNTSTTRSAPTGAHSRILSALDPEFGRITLPRIAPSSESRSQASQQPRIPPLCAVIPDGHAQGFLLPDQDHQLLAPRDSGVDQVPLKQDVVLGGEGNYDCRELRSLRFMDRHGICQRHLVQVAEIALTVTSRLSKRMEISCSLGSMDSTVPISPLKTSFS